MPLISKWDYSVINPVIRRSLEKPLEDQVREISEGINIIAQAYSGIAAITGGVAIQLGIGEFYRLPGNLNLSVARSNLKKLADKAPEGYVLVSRGWSIPQPGQQKYENYERVTFDSNNRPIKHYQNMRLVKFGKARPFSTGASPVINRNFLDYIDVHAHVYEIIHGLKEKSEKYFLKPLDPKEKSLYIPKSLASPNGERQIDGGSFDFNTASDKITVRGLNYMEYVKTWLLFRSNKHAERKKIDWFDLGKIYHALGKNTEESIDSLCKFTDLRKLRKTIGLPVEVLAELWTVPEHDFMNAYKESISKQQAKRA